MTQVLSSLFVPLVLQEMEMMGSLLNDLILHLSCHLFTRIFYHSLCLSLFFVVTILFIGLMGLVSRTLVFEFLLLTFGFTICMSLC